MRSVTLGLFVLIAGVGQAYPQEAFQVVQSLPCSIASRMVQRVFGNSFKEENEFAKLNSDVIPADAWTPAVFTAFRARALQCSRQDIQTMRLDPGLLSAVLDQVGSGLDRQRQKAADEKAQADFALQAQASRRRQKINDIGLGFDNAISSTSTAEQLAGRIADLKAQLQDPMLTGDDRRAFQPMRKKLDDELATRLSKEEAAANGSKADEDALAKQENDEIERLQKLNDAKKTQLTADKDRLDRLNAAKQESARLDQAQAQAKSQVQDAVDDPENCPAVKAQEQVVKAKTLDIQEQLKQVQKLTPYDLQEDPTPVCNIYVEQENLFQSMADAALSCPSSEKITQFRGGMQAMVRQNQMVASRMGCH